MSEYDIVEKTSLKLKGVSNEGKIHKKKKKKSKSKETEEEPPAPQASTSYYRGKTKTELQFLKRKEDLETERIKKKASVSHKERVEKFNEYLNNLSEHYEPAKVSWTK